MDHTRFDWDEANIGHIAKHAVTPEEAEYALDNNPYDISFDIRNQEERISQLGQTAAGSILVLITTQRRAMTRVITAFPANRLQKKLFIATQKKACQ